MKNESSQGTHDDTHAHPQPSLDGLIRRLVTATPEELASVEQVLDGGENLRMLSVVETSKRLRVSPWYVYDLMRRGLLEYSRPRGKFCKIPERVVDAYLTNLTKGGNIGKTGKGRHRRAGINKKRNEMPT